MTASKESIRAKIESQKNNIQSDNPQVEITRLKIQAIEKLADQNNDIFSQLKMNSLQDETFDYALAVTYARHPLKNLEERLKAHGIKEEFVTDIDGVKDERDIRIKVDIFEEFLKEFLIRRHSLNRKRVEEYIEALDTASSKNTDVLTQQPRQGLLGRLV